jgi:protein-S-isoprenylcysteine O-methyltransferase Ste14
MVAASPLVYLVAIAVHLAAPWAVSRLSSQHGWSPQGPSLWNLAGVAPIALGIAGLLWACVAGLRRARDLPDVMTLDWTPKFLLRSGPWSLTRNPIYVSELAMWLGAAVYFGSVAVSVACVMVWWGQTRLIGVEERDLEHNFGDAYRAYKASVPRWLGRRTARRFDTPHR